MVEFYLYRAREFFRPTKVIRVLWYLIELDDLSEKHSLYTCNGFCRLHGNNQLFFNYFIQLSSIKIFEV